MEVCLGEFDFAHIELAKARDCIPFVDLCWGSALGSGEDDVDEIFPGGNHCDLLEIVLNHFE